MSQKLETDEFQGWEWRRPRWPLLGWDEPSHPRQSPAVDRWAVRLGHGCRGRGWCGRGWGQQRETQVPAGSRALTQKARGGKDLSSRAVR